MISADGSHQTLLTSKGSNRRPSWSPDGKLIAFDSTRDRSGTAREIYIMKADGTEQTRITAGDASHTNFAPAWSPDGRSIAFACGESDVHGNGNICVMRPDGTGIHALTNNRFGRDIDPAWSPDGKTIVFESSGLFFVKRAVLIMNADGSDLKKIATGTNDVLSSQAHPVFSPDGTRIAFGNDPALSFGTNIETMNPDGSGEIKLTDNPIDANGTGTADDDPSWGRKFLPETTGVYAPSTGQWLLRNANSTGGADFVVTFGRPGDLPVAGDWDGDGRTDIAVFRDGHFIRALLKPLDPCLPCQPILFAAPLDDIAFGEAGDLPLAGDWNGDGIDDLGVFRAPKLGTFLLRVPLGETFTTQTIPFGSAGTLPVAGDWNNDGKDEVGVYNPAIAEFSLTEDGVEPTFIFPFGFAGDRPLAGDWRGIGVDGVGVFDPVSRTMRLGTRLTFPPDVIFQFGVTEGLPVAGHWTGAE